MKNEIHGIVQNYVQNLEIEKQEQDIKRQETITKLIALRKRTIKLVANANKTLTTRQTALEEINKGICKVQGHTYTEWEMHNGPIDRTWYYTRSCEMCGKQERVENEPNDFKKNLFRK